MISNEQETGMLLSYRPDYLEASSPEPILQIVRRSETVTGPRLA